MVKLMETVMVMADGVHYAVFWGNEGKLSLISAKCSQGFMLSKHPELIGLHDSLLDMKSSTRVTKWLSWWNIK